MGALSHRLLDDRFAPITWHDGFLNVALQDAAAALMRWRHELGNRPEREDFTETLAGALRRLPPLVVGARPRELLVEVSPTWTAYFDCLFQGTDAASAISYLAQHVGCLGMTVGSVRGSDAPARVVKPPATSFTLYGAARTDWLNRIRSVASINDGDRWEFTAVGRPQPFEDLNAYAMPQVKDRLTPALLERYGTAVIGRKIFESSEYGPRCVLVRSSVAMPAAAQQFSIEEAQRWFGLTSAASH
jgi:hypothetical protein